MIDFTMSRVLKAAPGVKAVYQGQSTSVPVLLQPVAQSPVIGAVTAFIVGPPGLITTPVANFAQVQLGSRLVLLLPLMVAPQRLAPVGPAGPETQYTYTPVWRLRSPLDRQQQPQLGHALPLPATPDPLSQSQEKQDLIVAWTSAPITPPAAVQYESPLPPPGTGSAGARLLLYYDGMQLTYPTPPTDYYPTPYARYEVECEGDEFALLVQPVGPVRDWDFGEGAVDANFAYRYMETPSTNPAVIPFGYQPQVGAYVLTGERSP